MDSCLDRNNETGTINKKLVGILFDKTKDYPLLHSSHTMNRAVYTAIGERIPEVIDYIRSRMIKSPQLKTEKMLNNALNEDKVQHVNNFSYVVEEFPIWANKKDVNDSCFNNEGIPTRLDLCFFDISYITDQSKDSDEFFNVLATKDVDMDIFDEEIMQIIIERAWQESKMIFFLFLALPYIILLILFFTWSNFLTVGE